MPDKVSLSKRTIKSIKNFERVALCTLEAADRINLRLFLYALALWHFYRFLSGKH